jgi:hypothetical protein
MRRSILLLSCIACGSCQPNQTYVDNYATYEAGTSAPLSCVPNLDGVIDSTEVAPVLGVPVRYLVSPSGESRPVNLAGTTNAQGQLVWDLGTDYADDQLVSIQASALTSWWFASSFPNGQFVTPFDAAQTLQAVYSQDDNGLYLQGIASTVQNPSNGETLFVYETPVTLYTFPLKAGTTWTSTGVVRNGMVEGLQYAGQDTYQGTDVATGQLILPDFTFTQAHRLAFIVTTVPAAGETVVTRQDSFLFECFGEVARATSEPNETNDDFTTASQVRRFGPQQ